MSRKPEVLYLHSRSYLYGWRSYVPAFFKRKDIHIFSDRQGAEANGPGYVYEIKQVSSIHTENVVNPTRD